MKVTKFFIVSSDYGDGGNLDCKIQGIFDTEAAALHGLKIVHDNIIKDLDDCDEEYDDCYEIGDKNFYVSSNDDDSSTYYFVKIEAHQINIKE